MKNCINVAVAKVAARLSFAVEKEKESNVMKHTSGNVIHFTKNGKNCIERSVVDSCTYVFRMFDVGSEPNRMSFWMNCSLLQSFWLVCCLHFCSSIFHISFRPVQLNWIELEYEFIAGHQFKKLLCHRHAAQHKNYAHFWSHLKFGIKERAIT